MERPLPGSRAFHRRALRAYREGDDSLVILAHPERPPDELAEADFVGSTSGMINYVDSQRPPCVVMIIECFMASNVSVNFPSSSSAAM